MCHGGLLVLALSSFALACGDDDGARDENTAPHDGRRDAGLDGGVSGDAGDAGAAEGGDGGGTDGSAAAAECVDGEQVAAILERFRLTDTPDCLACLCGNDPEATIACDDGCWDLVACVCERCGCDRTDLECISACPTYTAERAAAATAFAPVINDCVAVDACMSAPIDSDDAGAD
jgi:hypothetical protein